MPHLEAESLPAYMFALKNGSATDRERYRDIQSRFETLIGTTTRLDVRITRDVTVKRRDPRSVGSGGASPNPIWALAYDAVHHIEDEPAFGLQMTIQTGRTEVPIELSGAGHWEAAYLACVLEARGHVVWLDEPGSNLHPRVQRRLVKEVNASKAQTLIVTHSPYMVDELGFEKTVRVFWDAATGSSRLTRWSRNAPNPDVRLKLEQVLRRPESREVLFSDGVILVEGETETAALPVWSDKSGASAGEQFYHVFVWVGPKSDFWKYVHYLRAFEIPWAIVCDGDALNDAKDGVVAQLKDASKIGGLSGDIPDAWTSFPARRDFLESFRVFTVNNKASETFESFLQSQPELADAYRGALSELGDQSKPRVGRYVAETTDCPDRIREMVVKLSTCLTVRDPT